MLILPKPQEEKFLLFTMLLLSFTSPESQLSPRLELGGVRGVSGRCQIWQWCGHWLSHHAVGDPVQPENPVVWLFLVLWML